MSIQIFGDLPLTKEESCEMLKMIHASDFHLDGNYQGLSPQRAAERRGEQQAFLDSFRRTVTEREVDLVLLSGDLFQGNNVYPETIDALITCLGSLPCWVFITPGEHDYYGEKSPYALWTWPKNVYIFKDEKTKAVTPPAVEGKPRVTIYGNAYTSPVRSRSPLAKFTPPQNWSGYHIMLSHGAVLDDINGPIPEKVSSKKVNKPEPSEQDASVETEIDLSAEEEENALVSLTLGEEHYPLPVEEEEVEEVEESAPILLSEISNSKMHYLALGGDHTRSKPKLVGRTHYTYSGSAQGQNFQELEARGVLYLELEITGGANMSFLPLESRQYHAVMVDITGQETLLENLRKGLAARYPDRHRDIFRVILTGEALGPNLQSLKEGLVDEFYGLEIVDQSVLPSYIWKRKDDESLIALFLQEMEQVSPENTEGKMDNETYQLALRLGLAALENREDFAL